MENNESFTKLKESTQKLFGCAEKLYDLLGIYWSSRKMINQNYLNKLKDFRDNLAKTVESFDISTTIR